MPTLDSASARQRNKKTPRIAPHTDGFVIIVDGRKRGSVVIIAGPFDEEHARENLRRRLEKT